MEQERFIIVKGSESQHCCFEYTVVDTIKGRDDYLETWNKPMCETFDKEDAETICKALNQTTKN